MRATWPVVILATVVGMLAAACALAGDPDPCDRSIVVRDALERATGRKCDLITDGDLARVGALSLWPHESDQPSELKDRDFAGLGNVTALTVRSPNWAPEVLSTRSQIQELAIVDDLHDIQPGSLAGFDNVQKLTLGVRFFMRRGDYYFCHWSSSLESSWLQAGALADLPNLRSVHICTGHEGARLSYSQRLDEAFTQQLARPGVRVLVQPER